MTAHTIREIIPEFDPLSEDHEAKITQFIADVKLGDPSVDGAYYRGASAEDIRVAAYKFLTARKWHHDNAKAMLEATRAFRKERRLDEGLFFPSPIPMRGYDAEALRAYFGQAIRPRDNVDRVVQSLRPHYRSNFHKWDKSGHPVLIELTGRIQANEALGVLKHLTPPGVDVMEAVAEMHIFQNELAAMLARYQDASVGKAANRRITTSTIILDAEGLGMGHLSSAALNIVKATSVLDQHYYPEAMHRLFVVNCPTIVTFAYGLVKSVLDERVRGKITFCGPAETKEVLLKIIDAEHLPEFLGGTCKCDGGCVCSADAASIEAAARMGPSTEEIYIKAGSKAVHEIPLAAGATTSWSFESVGAAEVDFSVYWRAADALGATAGSSSSGAGAGAGKPIVDKVKAVHHSGRHVAVEDGVVVLIFSNKASWVASRTIRLLATTQDTPSAALPANQTSSL